MTHDAAEKVLKRLGFTPGVDSTARLAREDRAAVKAAIRVLQTPRPPKPAKASRKRKPTPPSEA